MSFKLKFYIKDEKLIKKLTPNFELGCRRTLMCDAKEYFDCFNNKKLELIDTGIAEFS